MSEFKGAAIGVSPSNNDFLAARDFILERTIELTMKPMAKTVVSLVKKLPLLELEKTA